MTVNTFDDDLLGLGSFAQSLERFLMVEREFVDGSLVVSINSRFGTGKSTFLRMWQDRLANDSPIEDLHVTAVNAWLNDYCGEPLYSIISALAESFDDSAAAHRLVNSAKNISWFGTSTVGQVLKHFTGVDPAESASLSDDKKAERKLGVSKSLNEYSVFESRLSAMLTLRVTITDVLQNNDGPVLILVDELDRCRPDYAISYLETMKHFFDIEGVIFVLAIDKAQLCCSAKKAFGDDLDFDEYYRKFVDRDVSLPQMTQTAHFSVVQSYVGKYLKSESVRGTAFGTEEHDLQRISRLATGLKMTLRQTQEMFRLVGHIFSTETGNQTKANWCLSAAILFMAGLRVADSQRYRDFSEEPQEGRAVFEDLRRLFGEKDANWWFWLVYTGGGIDVGQESPQSSHQRLSDSITGLRALSQDSLNQYASGWGHSIGPRFTEIYSKIEGVDT